MVNYLDLNFMLNNGDRVFSVLPVINQLSIQHLDTEFDFHQESIDKLHRMLGDTDLSESVNINISTPSSFPQTTDQFLNILRKVNQTRSKRKQARSLAFKIHMGTLQDSQRRAAILLRLLGKETDFEGLQCLAEHYPAFVRMAAARGKPIVPYNVDDVHDLLERIHKELAVTDYSVSDVEYSNPDDVNVENVHPQPIDVAVQIITPQPMLESVVQEVDEFPTPTEQILDLSAANAQSTSQQVAEVDVNSVVSGDEIVIFSRPCDTPSGSVTEFGSNQKFISEEWTTHSRETNYYYVDMFVQFSRACFQRYKDPISTWMIRLGFIVIAVCVFPFLGTAPGVILLFAFYPCIEKLLYVLTCRDSLVTMVRDTVQNLYAYLKHRITRPSVRNAHEMNYFSI